MTHCLRSTFLIALVLSVFTGIYSASAQATEFHCSVEPCRYTMNNDGTGKTAHQVLIVKNNAETEAAFFTCEKVSGEATSELKAASELTFEAISYPSCTINGSPGVTVAMNGCKYKYAAGGTFSIVGCNAGKAIELQVPGGCAFSIGEQGPVSGVTYHNIGEEANTTAEITTQTSLGGLTVSANASCSSLINPNQELRTDYRTGNTVLTGETTTPTMTKLWWK